METVSAADQVTRGGSDRPPGWRRLFLAVLAVPLVATGIAFLAVSLDMSPGGSPGRSTYDMVEAAGSLAAGVFLVAALVTVIIVLPLAVSWGGRGLLTRDRILLTGLLLGNAPLILVILGTTFAHLVTGRLSIATGDAWYGWFGAFRTFVFGSLIGGGTAFVFWIVGVRNTVVDDGADGLRPGR